MNAPWRVVEAVPENVLKERFAEAFLKTPNDAFGAACRVFGADTIRALAAAQQWPLDTHVLQTQAALLDQWGEDHFLPSRAELARRVWQVGEMATDERNKLAAFKLYAEVRNFVAKDQINIQNNVTNNRVMVMKDFGTDENWEKAAAKQQSKLIEHSRD